MKSALFLDIGSQILANGAKADYLLMAVNASTGETIYFDTVDDFSLEHWIVFLSSILVRLASKPQGIVHPANPDIEKALDSVFKNVPRQICINHFLSVLYRYIRSFSTCPLGYQSSEMRFHTAIRQLLRANTLEDAREFCKSLRSRTEFSSAKLQNTLTWVEQRLPLLTTYLNVPGLPSKCCRQTRLNDEPIELLKVIPVKESVSVLLLTQN